MLGLPSYDISNPGNSLHFCLSGRLQQSWSQREPYSWRLTRTWLLPVPTVPLSLHQAQTLVQTQLLSPHLHLLPCYPPWDSMLCLKASRYVTLVTASKQQVAAQLPQPTACARVFQSCGWRWKIWPVRKHIVLNLKACFRHRFVPHGGFPASLCIQLPSLWKPEEELQHVQEQPQAPWFTSSCW